MGRKETLKIVSCHYQAQLMGKETRRGGRGKGTFNRAEK